MRPRGDGSVAQGGFLARGASRRRRPRWPTLGPAYVKAALGSQGGVMEACCLQLTDTIVPPPDAPCPLLSPNSQQGILRSNKCSYIHRTERSNEKNETKVGFLFFWIVTNTLRKCYMFAVGGTCYLCKRKFLFRIVKHNFGVWDFLWVSFV